jgi:uncharacterized protein YbjT (DUF2867 family)
MILAAGATGRLRPVVEELLVRGHDVRVTARDPGSSVARALAGRGVEIVRSDLDDVDSLSAAARGVDTIFAAGSPHRAGPEGETRHGINVAEAAADADVGHLVFSSGAGADQPTGVPVLDSKHSVEQRIHGLGVPHTILAPVYLMENAFNPWNLSAVAAGTFPLALPPDRLLQQLAIEDLAALAATVIERRDEFLGQRIELAGDELNGQAGRRRGVAGQRPPLRLRPGSPRRSRSRSARALRVARAPGSPRRHRGPAKGLPQRPLAHIRGLGTHPGLDTASNDHDEERRMSTFFREWAAAVGAAGCGRCPATA